jgi:hypothetical protein
MTAAIVIDVIPAPNRFAEFADAMAAVDVQSARVAPADLAIPGAIPIKLPDCVFPAAEPSLARRGWWRGYLYGVAAGFDIFPDADFLWIIESDTWATVATWQRLIRETAGDPSDFIGPSLRKRREIPDTWFAHPTTPAWADWYSLHALIRVSARGMVILDTTAPDTREVFCEISAASTIAHHGGQVTPLNLPGPNGRSAPGSGRWLHNCQTLVAPPARCIPNPRLINHPCKADAPPLQ